MLSTTFGGTEYRFFSHIYAVSACGMFLRKLAPYSPTLRPDGYLSVGGKRLAHRMVAALWCDRPEGAKHVHHINHDKQDNRAENLMWLTPGEHMRDHHPGGSRGHKMSEDGKARLRALRLGSKTSEATKQKQREASLRLGCRPPPRPKGTKMDDASRLKMSLNSPNARGCTVFGVVYGSFSIAGRALGQKPHTLRKRCLSDNFPDYKVG